MNTYLRIVSDLGDSAAWIAAVAITAFICVYTGKAPWWRDAIGRTIVLLDVCLLAVLVPSLVYLANPVEFHNMFYSVWYKTLSTVVTAAVAGIMLTRIKLWLKIPHERVYTDDVGETE